MIVNYKIHRCCKQQNHPHISYRLYRKTTQLHLTRVLKDLFKNQKFFINARKESGLTINREPIELDIYFPDLNLAFEFQDDYHYFSTWYTQKTKEEIVARDANKKQLAEEKGITLLTIPFWWDGSAESLISSIRQVRSDLLQEHTQEMAGPISLEPPESLVNQMKKGIPGVGEPIQATFYSNKINPTGWMLFEKYDGIRAIWNCENKKFYSRFGNELRLPQEVVQSMPDDISLDGEFWFGRMNFNEARRISDRSDFSKISWEKFRFMVFDTPTYGDKMYKDRYSIIEQVLIKNEKSSKYITLAQFIECTGRDHLMEYSKKIMSEGAEGIILRNPDALYKHGRSKDIIKFKVFRDDEAKVVEQAAPNRWKCQLPNGIHFLAEAEESLSRDREPTIGDIVSFKFTQYSTFDGKPISPKLYRYRDDLTWQDVVESYDQKSLSKKKPQAQHKSTKGSMVNRAEKGYWSDWNNRRKFFDNFATMKGFNPNDPENWYRIQGTDIKSVDKGTSILLFYKGSYYDALSDLYPDIKWDWSKFQTTPPGYWKDPKNARKLLDEFAFTKGFNQNDPNKWYQIKTSDLTTKLRTMINAYGTLSKALLASYPELHWDTSCFDSNVPPGHWKDITNVRKFFDDFANSRGFNPNELTNWYKLNNKEVAQTKRGYSVLRQFGGSLRKALVCAYPEIQWNLSQFNVVTKGFWDEKSNRREFFDNFAAQNGFDPKDTDSWYNVKFDDIKSTKGSTILKLYGSMEKALMDVYPELRWDFSSKASIRRQTTQHKMREMSSKMFTSLIT